MPDSRQPAPANRAFLSPNPARPPEISFRPITEADHPFLCALYAAVRAEELAPVPWPEEAKQAFLASQFAAQHTHYTANYPGADLLLILRGNTPIGRVYSYRSPNEIRLMDIALVDAERGRGLGRLLIEELLNEARGTSRSITLHVEPNNPAKRLYESLGFSLIEQRGVNDFMGWKNPAGS